MTITYLKRQERKYRSSRSSNSHSPGNLNAEVLVWQTVLGAIESKVPHYALELAWDAYQQQTDGRHRLSLEQWRTEYNHVRPHSAKNYQPPAPEAVLIMSAN